MQPAIDNQMSTLKPGTIKKQKGVTLIELILVLGLMSYLTILAFSQKQLEFEQAKARDIGRQLNQYNNAVRSWVADNAGAADRVEEGTSWLKLVSCGGTSAKEYLPCEFPAASKALPIKFGRISLESSIKTTGSAPNQITRVTTTSSPFLLDNGKIRGDLSGLAAITAASGFTHNNTPTALATQDSYSSSPTTARITMLVSNNASTDAWLRTDGSNFMNDNINFNPLKEESQRQIHNISRLQNIASQSLYLGNEGGAAVGHAVIVDADQAIYGKLLVSNSRNLVNGIELTRGNLAVNSGGVYASNNIETKADVVAKRLIDIDDGSFVIDPNKKSTVKDLTAKGDIEADGHLKSKTKLEAPIFYDSDNVAYKIDPSAISRLLNVQIDQELYVGGRLQANEHIQLNKSVVKGSACSPNGLLGRDNKGMILACSLGTWSSPEGVEGKYTHLGTHHGTTYFNSGSRPILVHVSGGNDYDCGSDWSNRYSLTGYVSGTRVATAIDNNNSYAKVGYISFGVPANTGYMISSFPYACGAGQYNVSVFTL